MKAKRKRKMEENGTSLKGIVPWNKGEKYSNEKKAEIRRKKEENGTSLKGRSRPSKKS